MAHQQIPPEIARRIRWAFFDVDGVLTDGGLYYGADGESLKRFSVLDGHGLTMLREAGIGLGIISGRSHASVARRAAELQIHPVFLGVKDKLSTLSQWASQNKVGLADISHMGDDLPDLPVMQAVGLSASVPNGDARVRAEASWVAQAQGGHGAVREFCDALLAARLGLAG